MGWTPTPRRDGARALTNLNDHDIPSLGPASSAPMVLMAGFMGARVSVVGMLVQPVISGHTERPNAEQHNKKSEPPANFSLAKQLHNRLRGKAHSKRGRQGP